MLAAECLLSVSGIFPKEPLTYRQGAEAEKVPKLWETEVADFLASEKFRKFRAQPKVDHEKTYDALVRGTSPGELDALTAELRNDDIGREYEALLSNAREYLRARWPMLKVDTPTQPIFYTPGVTECARASATYAVVNDPGRILTEMSMGTLVAEQVEAFDALFPDLSKMLRAMLQAEIIKTATASGPVKLSWRIESTLRILFGMPPEAAIKPVDQPPPKMATPEFKVSFEHTATKTEAATAREINAPA